MVSHLPIATVDRKSHHCVILDVTARASRRLADGETISDLLDAGARTASFQLLGAGHDDREVDLQKVDHIL